MPSAFSLQKTWFPQCRSIFFQQILFRSSFSKSTNFDQINSLSSQQRSESRFSLKIARFQFSKTRYPTSASLSTHAHYTKSETSNDIQDLARAFVLSLEPGEFFSTFVRSTQLDSILRFRTSTNSFG